MVLRLVLVVVVLVGVAALGLIAVVALAPPPPAPVAVDRHLVQGMQPGAGGDSLRETNRTVTLEVTAEQATRIAVANRLGRLSLALRADRTPVEEGLEQRPLWGGDVSGAFAPAGAAAAGGGGAGATIRVFGGPGRVEEIRFR